MIEIKVHTLIAHTECAFLYSMDGEDGVFSLETVQRIFEEHPDEKDFRLNIHCQGGEIAEGLAIYDFLRTSGKNIYTNIEGACHSMAIVLLLAAPKENRTANPNSRALIHLPYLEWAGGTADELKKAEEMVRESQNAILDIYADRTELTREEAERIMAEEQFHSMDEMLKWGFIGKINSYNTNLSKTKQKTMNALLDKITNFLASLKNEVNEAVEDVKNYVIPRADLHTWLPEISVLCIMAAELIIQLINFGCTFPGTNVSNYPNGTMDAEKTIELMENLEKLSVMIKPTQ